eukprot:4197570-Amphidinium_carterae.1
MLRRSSPLELMAYGGPAGDPQVTADLNTIRAWQQKLQTSTLVWPLDESVWDSALAKRRGHGPIRHLKTLANRLGWNPQPGGWLSNGARRNRRTWNTSFRCPHWNKERRQVQLPENDDTMPACVKLHGLIPAPRVPAILTHGPAQVHRPDVGTVRTDGSGRHVHSNDPQHRRCGVGYSTDTQERVWLPLPGLKRALEECKPHEMVSDCKGVVKAVQALQTGKRQPKGRNRDLEQRALNALLSGQHIRWIKPNVKQADVDSAADSSRSRGSKSDPLALRPLLEQLSQAALRRPPCWRSH